MPTEILLRELFCDWSIFFSLGPSLAAGKMRQMYGKQAAVGIILKNHRQLPVCISIIKVAALGSLTRVTESIFTISK
jgi:hypothetical protein